MSLVRDNCLNLALAVDPKTKAGTIFTSSTIGTVDGDQITANRLIAIYNQARVTLQSELHAFLRKNGVKSSILVSENVVTDTAFVFSAGVATIPSGLMETILLTDSSGNIIPVVPIDGLQDILDVVSTTNKAVVQDGLTYSDPLGVLSGTNFVLRYVAVPAYTTTDITNGTTVESFNDKWTTAIQLLGEAIASEQGTQNILGLANAMIQKVIGAG